MTSSQIPHYDVIILGAGLSGIGAAYHIQNDCPNRSYTVLEGRAAIGGTWDLFKYPGIRSDSDMYTLGFPFNPWKNPKAIADGPAILKYIKDTASQFNIDKNIQFNHKVISANWSSEDKKWTLTIAKHERVQHEILQCNFFFACSGYYDYDQGYTPNFKGFNEFKGTIIHPQKWDTNLSYQDKKVIVIGSGATAVTLVPELAKQAAHVVMLQRSPTYIISRPSEDKIANFFKRVLPSGMAHSLSRWKNILVSLGFYKFARSWPDKVKSLIHKGTKRAMGDDFDMKHFEPKYKPWDQRLCVVPDGDLFKALRKGKAEIVTDTISHFTPKGIQLDSGEELEADIIVTATGLKVQLFGGMSFQKNGAEIAINDTHSYKGVMFSDVPNFAIAVGYTNASWTLKCDLNCTFVTRVLNHMKKHDFDTCIPRFDYKRFASEPLLDFDAGYIKRATNIMPKQGSAAPWKVYQNYIKDLLSLKYSSVEDEYLEYRK